MILAKVANLNKEDVKAEASKILKEYILAFALMAKEMDEIVVKAREQALYKDE